MTECKITDQRNQELKLSINIANTRCTTSHSCTELVIVKYFTSYEGKLAEKEARFQSKTNGYKFGHFLTKEP